MPRILRRYPYAQLVLVFSLLFSLLSTSPAMLFANTSSAGANVFHPDAKRAAEPNPSTEQPARAAETSSSTKAKEAYGGLPLSFEANTGQTNRKVKFLARGQGYGLFLTGAGPVMSLTKNSGSKTDSKLSLVSNENEPSTNTAVVSWHMVGANKSPRISGIDALPGKANYFRGNDPSQWRSNISTYSKVRYSNVYPGIDVVYYGNQRQLEYDFIVAPGKDPNRIKLNFNGAEATELDAQGNLVLRTGAGDIKQAKPFAYQEIAGVRREVSARYRVVKGLVSFSLEDYDRTQPLIIDPVLIYSSFLGGINGEEGRAIAVDSQGNAYLTGKTFSTDFPVVGAFQATKASPGTDAFVVKVNPSGNALVYSTYLGGNSNETGNAIKIDADGNAYIAGFTFSTNFPTTAGALQPSPDIGEEGFVTKINASGSALVYSTYVGGDNADNISALAIGSDGRAVVVGDTDSSRFKTNLFPNTRNWSTTFKSTDRADHWLITANGITASAVTCFAIQPGNSAVVYAGTNIGIFKSTDGGSNWNSISLPDAGAGTRYVHTVVIDPSNSSIVYVATEVGLYKSLNAGADFALQTSFGTQPITALAIDPSTPATLYAGTFFGLFKSTNAGTNWAEVVYGPNISSPFVTAIVIDPTNPTVVYVGTSSDGLFKTNGGNGWTSLNSGLLAGGLPITALTIDPLNPAVLYAAIADQPNLVKTTNAGASWSNVSVTYELEGITQFPQINALAIDPLTTNTLYAATFAGAMLKTTNGGTSWIQSNTGLNNPYLNAVTVDPNNPAIVFAGGLLFSDAFAARINASGSALEYVWNFGGDSGEATSAVALDADGNAYITGQTGSSNFPTVNAFQSTPGKFGSAFIAKLNTAGTSFVFSTFFVSNNTSTTSANGIAVRDGSAIVVGQTNSPDFPVVNAYQPVLAGNDDAFVSKFNASGSALDFSTYLGGTGADSATGVALDAAGAIYVTGRTDSFNFPVLSAAQNTIGGGRDAFVTQLTAAANQLVYSTYLGGSASDQANGIAVDSLGSAYVTGATSSNNFPTLNAFQSVRKGNDAFFTKIGPASSLATNVQFAQATYQLNESAVGVQVVVTRTGHTSGETTVNYETSDSSSGNCNNFNGFASSKCDYEASFGTLHFAAGETSKTIYIPIVDDSFAEGNETFTVSLTGTTGATLGSPSATTITIIDNELVNDANPIDNPNFFVRQHYIDFLNREPDAGGLAFWSNQIIECQQPGAGCSAAVRRINVSAAFFLSIEFQETGYLVERLYKTAFGDATGTSNFGPTHQLPVPIVRLNEFLPDTQQIGKGLVVGQPGWEQVLENNKVAFILQFVQRSRFSTSYSALLTPAQFVDQLFANAGVTPTAAERAAAINEFGGAPTSNDNPARARALRLVAENSTLNGNEKNRAFVLMQYFGYLRRNANDPQDTDYSGYDFWLTKLNEFNGNFVNADMVQAFIDSGEYRGRFGP